MQFKHRHTKVPVSTLKNLFWDLFQCLLLLVLFLFIAFIAAWNMISLVEYGYQKWASFFGLKETELKEDLPKIYISIFAATLTAGVALYGMLYRFRLKRLSGEKKNIEKATGKVAEIKRSPQSQKFQELISVEDAEELAKSMLFQYETVATLIIKSNPSKDIYPEILRADLCQLVFRTRNIIFRARKGKSPQNKPYENLAYLYQEWKNIDNSDEWEKGMDLG